MKKNLLIIAVLLLFSSCATIDKVPQIREMIFVDYARYSEKGFLFTPYIINGDFDPVGPVEYYFSPGAEYKNMSSGNYPISEKQWVVDSFDIYTAIDDVYNECLKMKADALIETKITTGTNTLPNMPLAVIPTIKITGFAVKRK